MALLTQRRVYAKATLPALIAATLGLIVMAGCGGSDNNNSGSSGLPSGAATTAQVTQGRAIVVSAGCSDCHSRSLDDPSSANWLSGYTAGTPGQPFAIGPFLTYPANLTPDTTNGLGRYTDRQIYNALKYGLDPGNTPDVIITSTTPGTGNFPATPHYLAPPMPWPAVRHYADSDIWAIVAYLKHGIGAVSNAVPDSTGPPDFWASSYTADKVGPATLPAYPSGNEHFAP